MEEEKTKTKRAPCQRDKRDLPRLFIARTNVYGCCSHCGLAYVKRMMEKHWLRNHPLLLAEAKERSELTLLPGKDPVAPEYLWGIHLLDKVGWRSCHKDPIYSAYVKSFEALWGKKLQSTDNKLAFFIKRPVNRIYKKGIKVKCPNLGFTTKKKQ